MVLSISVVSILFSARNKGEYYQATQYYCYLNTSICDKLHIHNRIEL